MLTNENSDLARHATAYVRELYRELTAENVAPTLGTQNQVVDFILGDRLLSNAVEAWARRYNPDEARVAAPQRLPPGEAHRRVAAKLRSVMTGQHLPPPTRDQG
jgi:predicted transcriptional regulator